MECIVLAGGLGTRLQGVIGAQAKCMAPLNGRPFLSYLFEHLDRQRCTRVIMSLGYKNKDVLSWLEDQDLYFELDCVVESEPLGTGGGILGAIEQAETDDVVVVNGDTFFGVNLRQQMKFHIDSRAETTLALKEMTNFERYGTVTTNNKGVITQFSEKQKMDKGFINGGVYIINKEAFLKRNLPEKFSFEKDYLEKLLKENRFYGFASSEYFIDIGVPEDYAQAAVDFKTMFP